MILIPPPPRDSYKELNEVICQYSNPTNPEYMQHDFDKNIAHLFSGFLQRNKLPPHRKRLKILSQFLIPSILIHKRHFNRARPEEYARKLNLKVEFDQLKTAQSPSYPSGHSTQAYVLAMALSSKYPHLKKELFHLANSISLSRVDRGVHYPSDLDGGHALAIALMEKLPLHL